MVAVIVVVVIILLVATGQTCQTRQDRACRADGTELINPNLVASIIIIVVRCSSSVHLMLDITLPGG